MIQMPILKKGLGHHNLKSQMNIQQRIALSEIYKREEDFSADLADNLDALRVGSFEDAETESNVGTRRADIVAVGEDGTLVIENQFEKADWDHWGRLEAYARMTDSTERNNELRPEYDETLLKNGIQGKYTKQ